MHSEGAMRNIKYRPIFEDLVLAKTCACINTVVQSIEKHLSWNIRKQVFGKSRSLWVEHDGYPFQIQTEDVSKVSLISKVDVMLEKTIARPTQSFRGAKENVKEFFLLRYRNSYDVLYQNQNLQTWLRGPCGSHASVKKILYCQTVNISWKQQRRDLSSAIITEEGSNYFGSIEILVSCFGRWKNNTLPKCLVWLQNIMCSKRLTKTNNEPVPTLDRSPSMLKTVPPTLMNVSLLEYSQMGWYTTFQSPSLQWFFNPRSLLYHCGLFSGV